jgi:queuine tRNA-ribosyltransferase
MHNNNRNNIIKTTNGTISLPAFLPDATYGAIKGLSFRDVIKTGISEIVTTTLHIEQKIGSEYLEKYGGIHSFLNWDRPILTDSGGFQVFSLIHRNKDEKNKITDLGASFRDYENDNKYSLLTPERSQVIQHRIGSDIRVVLDEPVVHDGPLSQAKEAVRRTTDWAKRSKKKFLELHNLTEKDFDNPNIERPLLVCVIQGGNNFELRKRSANELKEIGFDIYGFGGIPLHNTYSWREDAPKGFYHELLEYVTELVPDKPKYGLGIGTPSDIIFCSNLGWDLFDTVLPTRNGRHGYLYVSKGEGDARYQDYDVLHIKRKEYEMDKNPVDNNCDCECCTNVDRAYLRYLIRSKKPSGQRLATIHNLRFYSRIMQKLKDNIN